MQNSILEQAKVTEKDYIFRFFEKLKLYSKLVPETVPWHSYQNLCVIIFILPSSTRVFLQLGQHMEPLLHL